MIINNHPIYFAYFSNEDVLSQNRFRYEIFRFLWPLCFEYPRFALWYRELFGTNGKLSSNREIVICLHNICIIGVAILKKTNEEKKICTLRVDKKYQHNGIGKVLIEKSLEWLAIDKPLVTVQESKAFQFERLFKYYGFALEQQWPRYYSFWEIEQVYNGELPANKPYILTNPKCIYVCKSVQRQSNHNIFNDVNITNDIATYFKKQQNLAIEL